MKSRSQKIIITNEGRVLRTLRFEHGLSMKKAGALAGVSDSTIAHIETGRMNPPKGPALERLLKVYGGIQAKSFYERARNFKANHTAKEQLLELVQRANEKQASVLLNVAQGLLS
jgi:transcriptional regulator with XRE-family HTH domain